MGQISNYCASSRSPVQLSMKKLFLNALNGSLNFTMHKYTDKKHKFPEIRFEKLVLVA